MHFILVAILLSTQTGAPSSYERVGQPFDTPTDCVTAQMDQGIQKAADGHVRVFLCVREDQLRETST